MAEQSGIIPLKGTIGNITFYKGKEGYLAREKGGVSASKIASDPAFQRTRENNAEFGRAGKAGKLMRASLKALTQNASDSRMVSRLTRQFLRVVQADTTNDRGKRNVTNGNPLLLEGFEFNDSAKLGTNLFAPFVADIDRAAGTLEVALAPFVPQHMVGAPAGATHFRINSAGAAIDFGLEQYEVQTNSTAILPWDNVATAQLNLVNRVTAASPHPLFLVLGMEYFQEVNGGMYPLKNGAFNPLQLVRVGVI